MDNKSKKMLKMILKMYNENNKDEIIVIDKLYKNMNLNKKDFENCIIQLDNDRLTETHWAGSKPYIMRITVDGINYANNIKNIINIGFIDYKYFGKNILTSIIIPIVVGVVIGIIINII